MPGVAFARRRVRRFMTDIVSIQHVGLVSDGHGGFVEDLVTSYDGPARVTTHGQLSPQEREIAGQAASLTWWDIYLPAETDVPDDSRIVYQGHIYEVVAQSGPLTDEVYRRITAVERGGETDD